jgi:hypothetical protein
MVPRDVFDQLVCAEQKTGTYRTRVAANVLCNWATEQQMTQPHAH